MRETTASSSELDELMVSTVSTVTAQTQTPLPGNNVVMVLGTRFTALIVTGTICFSSFFS